MNALTWSDDRVERLKTLWAEGASAREIADDLGGGVTRCAVIGKAHRLKLDGRPRGPAVGRPPRERKARPRSFYGFERGPSRVAVALAACEPAAAEEAALLLDNVVSLGPRVTFNQLDTQSCRWPIGDPAEADFGFCGGRSLAGLPYCSGHSRLAYQSAGDRRRRASPAKSGSIDHAWR